MDFESTFQELSSGLGWGDLTTIPQISMPPLANYGYYPIVPKPYPWYMSPFGWPFEYSWPALQGNGSSGLPRSQHHIPSAETSPPASENMFKATFEHEEKSELLPSFEKPGTEMYETTCAGNSERSCLGDAGTNIHDLQGYVSSYPRIERFIDE